MKSERSFFSAVALGALVACGGGSQEKGAGESIPSLGEEQEPGGADAPTAAPRAAPKIAPPPFTAEEIRDATSVGKTYRFRVEEPDKEAQIIELAFVLVNERGARVERRTLDADGKAIGQPERSDSSWQEFVRHGSFPEKVTEIGEADIETPAGRFDCKLYTVKTDTETLRFYFANELPGPPVRLDGVVDGEVKSSMVLLAHDPGGEGGKESAAPEPIVFPSEDGLEITADLYVAHADPKTPFVVLFHQAGWSRGEYRQIAPRLSRLGFNAMAVDQRAGKEVEGVKNETAARAREAGKKTRYVDAEADLRAALAYARKEHAKGPLLAWGSSYSAALVLRVAGEHPDLVDGAVSFSPGEYFKKQGKPATWIRRAARKIQVPVFLTSARAEKKQWAPIYAAIPSKKKRSFRPKTPGKHGSSALWPSTQDSQSYWTALEPFLTQHFLKD